jgi:two-component system chemotaxis sensor kinase CheA
MNIDRAALMQAFLADSEEDLTRLEEAVLGLEDRPDDVKAIDAIFRTAHTLKGNAAMLSLDAFAKMSHALEDVLHALRSQKITVTVELTTMVLGAVDALRAMLAALRAGKPHELTDHDQVLAQLGACAAAAKEFSDNPSTGHGPAPLMPDDAAAAAAGADAQWDPVLRIEIAKLDQLLELAARASVVQVQVGTAMLSAQGTDAELWELHHKNERLLMELQDWVMDARMIPVSTFFRPHARTVRDAARAQRKRVRLQIEGERVRVDTGIGESVRNALTHLVRNAIDHGIEPPAARVAAGKNAEGTITLRAFPNGNQIVIQVCDDGGGFSLSKIRARARSLGRTNVDSLSADALYRMAFEAGFSTAEQVTEMSGRGVGMDVVLRSVEALHGTVDIDSAEGVGTTIELRLPLSVSVIEGFWVNVAGTEYVIPLDDVIECVEVPPDVRELAESEGIIDVRGEPLAYFPLSELLISDAGRAAAAPCEMIVVVRRGRDGRIGVAVDAVRGQRQTVIKPLGRLFRAAPGISGSTMRPDGGVALVIDLARLLRSYARHGGGVSSPNVAGDAPV